MTLSDIREERAKQLVAIPLDLATAPKIQEDLKAKYGYGENIFFDLDLIEYRINNSRLDIAEDLDVKSLYGIKKNDVAISSVSRAFRGHHNKEFMPDYQFNGLLGKVTNDMIEGIRKSKGGLITVENKTGVHALTSEELSELGRKGGLIGGRKLASMINPETGVRYLVEASRKGLEAQGFHVFSLEEIADIHNFREESFNHSSKFSPNSPNWNYTTSEMNEKYGENWSTSKVKDAYHRNKDKLPDEEE